MLCALLQIRSRILFYRQTLARYGTLNTFTKSRCDCQRDWGAVPSSWSSRRWRCHECRDEASSTVRSKARPCGKGDAHMRVRGLQIPGNPQTANGFSFYGRQRPSGLLPNVLVIPLSVGIRSHLPTMARLGSVSPASPCRRSLADRRPCQRWSQSRTGSVFLAWPTGVP